MVRDVKKQRSINLDLQTIRLSIMAIVSTLYRISGVITFVTVGVLPQLLDTSLPSSESFLTAASTMDSLLAKLIMWDIPTVLAYHVVVGIRHLMMDSGYLDKIFEAGKRPAKISFVVTAVLSLLTGVLVW